MRSVRVNLRLGCVASACVAVAVALTLGACGNQIGDACGLSTDCSPEGGRICDTAPSSNEGYCTIRGCDFGTCPEEAVCVRFFPVSQLMRDCDGQDDCTLDETCSAGKCAPRASEVRYCMLACSGHGDCRGGYECRNDARAQLHGGEPVPDPLGGASVATAFCASAGECRTDDDCATSLGDTCDGDARFCAPSSF